MPIECDALCWGFSEFQPTPREHLSRRSVQVFSRLLLRPLLAFCRRRETSVFGLA